MSWVHPDHLRYNLIFHITGCLNPNKVLTCFPYSTSMVTKVYTHSPVILYFCTSNLCTFESQYFVSLFLFSTSLLSLGIFLTLEEYYKTVTILVCTMFFFNPRCSLPDCFFTILVCTSYVFSDTQVFFARLLFHPTRFSSSFLTPLPTDNSSVGFSYK